MHFNSSECNFNDPESHCDNMNMGQTCLICLSDQVSLNFDKSASDTHLLFDTCCKYLHSAITSQVVMEQKNGTTFCNRCFESADQLADLTDKLEVFQKTVSEHILMFSLEILQRRAIPHQKAENIEVYGKKLVMCDLSGLNDFKETVTRSQENVVSLDVPPDSLDSGTSIFEGNIEQNIIGDPWIIPDEPAGATNFVTFESIIKPETFDNELSIQNYDQADIGEFHITKAEGVAHYKESMLKEQSLQKPPRSKRTGKRVTNKLNLIPFVKLKRLKLAGTTNTAAATENVRLNPFNVGAVKVYDNKQLLLQSHKTLSVVDTAMSIFTNKMGSVQQSSDILRYRPRSKKELDSDFEITKWPYKKNKCGKNEKPFKCTHCSMRFLHRGNLNVHIKIHSGANHYKCTSCSASFKIFSTLMRHLKSAHPGAHPEEESKLHRFNVHKEENETYYSCSVCRAKFKTKYYLNSHFKLHTADKPYTCSLCSKSFRHQSNLYVHKQRCKNDHKNVGNPPLINTPVESLAENGNPLECLVCHKQFTSQQGLRSHFRIHTGEKPYKCSICKRTFRFHSNHIVHMKRHRVPSPENKLPEKRGDPSRPLQYSECPKQTNTGLITEANEEEEMEIPCPAIDPLMFVETFTAKTEIQIFDAVTTENFNSLQCSECGKMFTKKINLEAHFRIHTGEKPFKCDRCDYAGTRAGNLMRHKLHRHSTVCQFKCRDCGRPFKIASDVKKHYKKVHFAIDFTNECILENSDGEDKLSTRILS